MGRGGIQPPPQARLQHEPIHLLGCEMLERCGDQQLEGGELLLRGHGLQILQASSQCLDADLRVIDANSLGPLHEMGRDGESAAKASSDEAAVHKAGNRTLAVGSHHLNRRHLRAGVIEHLEGAHHAVERKIHASLIKGRQQIAEAHACGLGCSALSVASSRFNNVFTSR